MGGNVDTWAYENVDDFCFTGPDSIATIRFDLYFNLIFLQLQIDNSEPLWFMLDSGFEESVINTTTADKLGLRVSGAHTEKAPGGDVEIAYIDSLTFRFPGVDITNQRAAAIALDGLVPVLGRPIDGILGHDYFARFVVEIDYANQNIIFHDPRNYSISEGWTRVPVTIENNEPFLYATLESEGHSPVKAKLKIDTGGADFLGFNGSFVKAENLFKPDQAKIPAQGAALGGYTKNYATRLKRFSIDNIVIENPVVGFSEDTLRGGDAGTIGGEFLKRFDLVFDYSRGEVHLRKKRHFNEPNEYDMSGIFPVAEPPDFKTIKVLGITENTPASEAGILPEDIITEIDGKAAGDYTIAEIRQLFMQDGKAYRLTIKRGEKVIEVTLILRRLI